jgi:hypothetical protein
MSRADAECTADKENRWSRNDSKTSREQWGSFDSRRNAQMNELRC